MHFEKFATENRTPFAPIRGLRGSQVCKEKIMPSKNSRQKNSSKWNRKMHADKPRNEQLHDADSKDRMTYFLTENPRTCVTIPSKKPHISRENGMSIFGNPRKPQKTRSLILVTIKRNCATLPQNMQRASEETSLQRTSLAPRGFTPHARCERSSTGKARPSLRAEHRGQRDNRSDVVANLSPKA
jgi:hypothetical protein